MLAIVQFVIVNLDKDGKWIMNIKKAFLRYLRRELPVFARKIVCLQKVFY